MPPQLLEEEGNSMSTLWMDRRMWSLHDILLSRNLTKSGVPGSNDSDPHKHLSRLLSTQLRAAIQGSALLQSSTEEYRVKANAKILPLIKF
jgi:hypothetical protein